MKPLHRMMLLSQESAPPLETNVPQDQPTPQKTKWELLRDMKWPVVALVALIGLFNSNLSKDFGDALNKPDIVAPDGTVKPQPLTQEEINNLIVKTIDAVLPKLLPNKDKAGPAPVVPVITPDKTKPVSPDSVVIDKPDNTKPVGPPVKPEPTDGVLAIMITDETGKQITASDVDAGVLFRVSPKNAAGKVDWVAVKHGDVRLIASTSGTEYAGYLTKGSWVDFTLVDYWSQKQVSLRISCNQGPMPPPVDPVVIDTVEPKPAPQPVVTNAVVSLYVLYNKDISADAAMIMTSTDVWDSFKKNGSDWRFVNSDDDTDIAEKIKADGAGTTVPSLLIYDRVSAKLLRVMPLPTSTSALVSAVAPFIGG